MPREEKAAVVRRRLPFNVTIPRKLRRKMARQEGVNWSQVATEAFTQYLEGRELNGADYVKGLEDENRRLREMVAKVQKLVKEE